MSKPRPQIHYAAEPTPKIFHHSDSFVRGMKGPIGTGKSSSMVVEILHRAKFQLANAQGLRRSRWAIIRNTFGELRTTTIKTWQMWCPESVCPIVYDSPIRGILRYEREDKTIVELELLFIALDQPKHVQKLLSLELTGAWINEAREVPKAILDALTGRVGRFPGKIEGGFNWSGIIMDTNPPDDDHWWYRLAEEECPEDYEFFNQPPAILWDERIRGWKINPGAENIKNQVLGEVYWLRQIGGKSREWIKVYLEGKYGCVQDGKPVYPQYNDATHTAREIISPLKNLPIYLGWDFGLTPAVVFGQITPRGRLNAIDEEVSESMGLRQFLRLVVLPKIATEYKGYRFISVGDPAGRQRSQADERTCFQELSAAGFETEAPWTNSFLPRKDAVDGFITRMVDGVPCLQVSPKCKILRKGFTGSYRYRRVQVAGEERYQDLPDKNGFSHPHDGFQYLCLYLQGQPLDFAENPGYDQNSDSKKTARPSNRIAGSM